MTNLTLKSEIKLYLLEIKFLKKIKNSQKKKMKTLLLCISFVFLLQVSLASVNPVDHLLNGEHPLTDSDLKTLFNYYQFSFASTSRFSHLFSNLTDEEKHYRQTVFNVNLEKILAHNRNPNKTYTQGINLFTGLTKQERKHYILGESQNCSATAQETLRVKIIMYVFYGRRENKKFKKKLL